MYWPVNLAELHLTGGLAIQIVPSDGLSDLAKSLRRLSITNCPMLDTTRVWYILPVLGPQLEYLCLHTLPGLRHSALDDILIWCPKLKRLSVATDYVTERLCCREEFFNGQSKSVEERTRK
jgi:hypothetical protein